MKLGGQFGIIILLLIVASNGWGQQKKLLFQDGKSLAMQVAKKPAVPQLATENQAHYDVHNYSIQLKLDPMQQRLQGNVAMIAEIVGEAIDQLEVNLANSMVVDSVLLASQSAAYTHADELITISLGRLFSVGEIVTTQIFYHGTPSRTGYGAFGFDTYNGRPMIWSLSEPFGARNWWPCKDLPEDKADSVTISITVPEDLIAVSNGLLRSETTANGEKTFCWHERYPIAPYLVAVTVHSFAHFADSVQVASGKYMPLDFYVFPENLEKVKPLYALTKDMITVYDSLFGDYPFPDEKYGHVQFLGGANMEHQTLTSLRENASEGTIAHELAHQWWGDLITCHDFGHIWLNEGFATYAAALWSEARYGVTEYNAVMEDNRYMGDGTIFVTQMDVGTIFNYHLSYRKSAWVLHMLRHVVGDSTFFSLLRQYSSASRFRYGTVTTEQFEQFCEEKTGKDLSDFFHQWIYESWFPHYVLSYQIKERGDFDEDTVDVYVRIRQEQTNTVLFHMPIDLRFYFGSWDSTIVINNRLVSETYRFSFANYPISVSLDPDAWVLKSVRKETFANVTDSSGLPTNYALVTSYPNPFQNSTRIDIHRLFLADISVEIFNLLGQRLQQLYTGRLITDELHLSWNGSDQNGQMVPPGTYFCRITQPQFSKSIKIVKLH